MSVVSSSCLVALALHRDALAGRAATGLTGGRRCFALGLDPLPSHPQLAQQVQYVGDPLHVLVQVRLDQSIPWNIRPTIAFMLIGVNCTATSTPAMMANATGTPKYPRPRNSRAMMAMINPLFIRSILSASLHPLDWGPESRSSPRSRSAPLGTGRSARRRWGSPSCSSRGG